MIDGVIKWSLQNRLLVIAGSALLLVWGGYEAWRMPVDVFPDLTAPTVTVLTEAHGMAPEEVETLITFPIETALNGAAGVRRVRSSSGIGISVVWVDFEWGANYYHSRQIVSEKLQLAQAALPPEIEPPSMAPVTSIMGEIMFIALSSEVHDPMALKTTADWVVRRRLLAMSGVAQVIPIGGDTKQYQVRVKPERLSSYGIALHQVVDAVRRSNENASAGFFLDGGQEYLIRGLGRVHRIEDIENTVVAVAEGEPILVKHLAEVKLGAALKRGEGSFNGQDAVIMGIQKQPGTNTLELTARLDAVLDEIQGGLPEGMTINRHIFRQADFIRIAIDNVFEALRDGALLVVMIVLLFLASWRATGITVIAIPLSLTVATLAMKWLGATINTMTLGGMAIAIGALVDDAIIDVENVTRRLRENATLAHPKSILTVVFEASKEIRVSIVFATLIIMLVFVPLFFLTGVEGRLLQPLGFAYIVSLAASLVTALTLTPALCSLFLPRSHAMRREKEATAVRWCKRAYRPILAAMLPRWRIIALLSVLLLAGAIWALSRMGQSFLPEFNEGSLTISAVTLPGTSLAESHEMGRMVENIILSLPEAVSTARRTGRAELHEHAQSVNSTEVEVTLRMRDRGMEDLLRQLRTDLALVPGMNFVIGQPISHRIDHMLSGARANIAVKLFGEDLQRLRRLGEEVRAVMETVPGVVDLSLEQQADIPFLSVHLKRAAIARYGLSFRHVAETIETAFVGTEVSRVLEGQATFDLLVRLDEGALASIETVRNTLLATPTGARVPLHALADIRKESGPNTISRENVQRKIVAMCNVAGRDLGGVVADIQRSVGDAVTLPEGYYIEYGGQFESAEEASRTLMLLGAAVIVGIFLLLFSALRSGRDALLVMVNLPFALIGGVAGVHLTGGVISVASIIGFITLFGIATRNGILLVSHIQRLWTVEGLSDLRDAVTRGAMERLSPILMTALTAGLALIPLALKAGEPGGEIEAPMAVVILCGLFTSTALNLVVAPALYLRFGKPPVAAARDTQTNKPTSNQDGTGDST